MTAALDYRALELERRARMGVPVLPIRSVTATGTVRESDAILLVDATGGAVVLTLPAANTMKGRLLWTKLMDASGNGVTLDGSGSETIDGSTTLAWTTQYTAYTIASDGSVWVII